MLLDRQITVDINCEPEHAFLCFYFFTACCSWADRLWNILSFVTSRLKYAKYVLWQATLSFLFICSVIAARWSGYWSCVWRALLFHILMLCIFTMKNAYKIDLCGLYINLLCLARSSGVLCGCITVGFVTIDNRITHLHMPTFVMHTYENWCVQSETVNTKWVYWNLIT